MRFQLGLLLVLLANITPILAQQDDQNDVNITALLALPQCVRDCGLEILPQFSCTPQQACYCNTDGPQSEALVACLFSTCPTQGEALEAQRFQAETCGFLVRDESLVVQVAPYTLFGIAALSIFARFLSRWPRLQGAGLSYDDFVVILCYLPTIGMTVVAYYEVKYGSGTEMWTMSIMDVRNFLLWFYVGQSFYLAVTYLTKLSLVLLYLRIWPESGIHSPFRTTCWIIAGLLLATWIATTLATIFACTPISYAWDSVVGEDGMCITRQTAVYAYAALNIAYDFVVLLLPIPRLLRLKVSPGEKIGISACFLVGFVVTACSIIRLTVVQGLENSRNVTWDFMPAGLWSLIEVYCSVICCCMPATAGLVKRCWRYLWGKPTSHVNITKESDPSSCGTVLTDFEELKGESPWLQETSGLEPPSIEGDSETTLVERTMSAGIRRDEDV